MAKPPGRCIYCGGTGLTKEHMWADWLRAYIPREMKQHRLERTLQFADPAKNVVSHHRKPGDPHSRRLRIVCRKCNNGWMGTLQEKAKPILVPMFNEQSALMYRKQQTILGAWVTMFVMTSEFLTRDWVSISADERAWFKEKQRPPSHWRIWIGQREPYETSARFHHRTVAFSKDESKVAPAGTVPDSNTQTTTALLGNHIVIHVMSSPVARRIIKRWQLPPAIDRKLQQIWPVTVKQLIWPSNDRLTAANVNLLAEHFFERIDRVAKKREGLA